MLLMNFRKKQKSKTPGSFCINSTSKSDNVNIPQYCCTIFPNFRIKTTTRKRVKET